MNFSCAQRTRNDRDGQDRRTAQKIASSHHYEEVVWAVYDDADADAVISEPDDRKKVSAELGLIRPPVDVEFYPKANADVAAAPTDRALSSA